MRGSAARGGGGGGWEGAGNAASAQGWWRHHGGGCREAAPLASPKPPSLHLPPARGLLAATLLLSPARERSCSSFLPALSLLWLGAFGVPRHSSLAAFLGSSFPWDAMRLGVLVAPRIQHRRGTGLVGTGHAGCPACAGGDAWGPAPPLLHLRPDSSKDASRHCQLAPNAVAGMGAGCWMWPPPAHLRCFAIIEQALEQPAEGRREFSAW